MYGIDVISKLNREAGRKAKGKQPYIAKMNGDPDVFLCPNFGTYRAKGWRLVQRYFVNNSGFGSDNEPALTPQQFRFKVKEGFGYAVIETGWFQVYIGEFRRTKTT
jgi:hypothetical protein